MAVDEMIRSTNNSKSSVAGGMGCGTPIGALISFLLHGTQQPVPGASTGLFFAHGSSTSHFTLFTRVLLADDFPCIFCSYTWRPKVWERFNAYWLSRRVPVHVVRYEDLLSDPEATLVGLVAFIHVRPTLASP